jgi:hypothetical protein
LTLIINDADNKSEGVSVKADGVSGLIPPPIAPGIVSSCDGHIRVSLNVSAEAIITCSSADIRVINGTVNATLITIQGINANVTISVGNKLLFDPVTSLITAPSTNNETLFIFVRGGNMITLSPGESKKLFTSTPLSTSAVCPENDTQHWDKIVFEIKSPDLARRVHLPANTELDIKVRDDPTKVTDIKGKVLSFLHVPTAPVSNETIAWRNAIQILNVGYAIICAA